MEDDLNTLLNCSSTETLVQHTQKCRTYNTSSLKLLVYTKLSLQHQEQHERPNTSTVKLDVCQKISSHTQICKTQNTSCLKLPRCAKWDSTHQEQYEGQSTSMNLTDPEYHWKENTSSLNLQVNAKVSSKDQEWQGDGAHLVLNCKCASSSISHTQNGMGRVTHAA